jgi:hypothetical protein
MVLKSSAQDSLSHIRSGGVLFTASGDALTLDQVILRCEHNPEAAAHFSKAQTYLGLY